MGFEDYRKKAPNTMCLYPFTYVNFWPSARFGPCCAAKEFMGEETKGVGDFFNSEAMKRIRRQLVSGQRPKECMECWNDEDLGVKSMRQESYDIPYLYEGVDYGSFDSVTGVKTQGPGVLKIALSNLCNLQCRMCNSIYSTKWESFFQTHPALGDWLDKYDYDRGVFNSQPVLREEYFDQLIAFVRANRQSLRRIEFIGGEPLIQPIHFRLLDELKEYGHQLDLGYSSNLMRLGTAKHDVIEYWRHFKEVNLTVSIDGPRLINDYVRAGSDWQTIENNLARLQSSCQNTNFHVYTAISLYNVFDLIETVRYTTRLGLFTTASALIGPTFLSTQLLPTPVKKEITDEVRSFLKNLEQELAPEFAAHPIWQEPHLVKMQAERLRERLENFLIFMNGEPAFSQLSHFFEFDQLLHSYLGGKSITELVPRLEAIRPGRDGDFVSLP